MLKQITEIVRLLYWFLSRKEVLIPTFGSYGDLMMVNGVFKYYAHQQNRPLRIVYKKNILQVDPSILAGLTTHSRTYYLAVYLAKWTPHFKLINYGALNDPDERNTHLMQRMANRLHLTLPPAFTPFINLTQGTFPDVPTEKPWICILGSANTAYSPNKEWDPIKMSAVVTALNNQFTTIQIGLESDPVLPTSYRMNGQIDFLQSVQLLSQSKLFIGPEGAFMHAAAAINIPAVIIFGGYIHPHQSGYHNTTGIKSDIACAPCLLTSPCPIALQCMKEIAADTVLSKAYELLS